MLANTSPRSPRVTASKRAIGMWQSSTCPDRGLRARVVQTRGARRRASTGRGPSSPIVERQSYPIDTSSPADVCSPPDSDAAIR
jgi:hypothetical protein